MSCNLWLTFVAALTALLLIPGPAVLIVLRYAVPAASIHRTISRPLIITWLTRAGGARLSAMGILTATFRSAQ